MKLSRTLLAALTGTAAASPILETRQMTANDLKSGSCKKVTLVFARASTEPGNMGMSMGPATCSGLKAKFAGSVACQGVGGPYTAGLMDNVSPAGTTQGAINEAIKMFTEASTKCPQTIIVGGGYSQGSAVMMNSVSKLPEEVKRKVVGVVLFGYTKNAQQKGGIPNYPKENVKVFCSAGDGVCGGTLLVTAGHFSYMMDGSGPQAVAFLTQKINSYSPGSGGSSGGSGGALGGGKLGGGKGKGAKGGGKLGGGKGSLGGGSSSGGGESMEGMEGMEGMAGHSHGGRI